MAITNPEAQRKWLNLERFCMLRMQNDQNQLLTSEVRLQPSSMVKKHNHSGNRNGALKGVAVHLFTSLGSFKNYSAFTVTGRTCERPWRVWRASPEWNIHRNPSLTCNSIAFGSFRGELFVWREIILLYMWSVQVCVCASSVFQSISRLIKQFSTYPRNFLRKKHISLKSVHQISHAWRWMGPSWPC